VTDIYGFKGENRWLSNFWEAPFFYGQYTWPTVEHAFVSHKVTVSEYAEVAEHVITLTPGQAKRYGRSVCLRADWDLIKLLLMTQLQEEKYKQNPGLMKKLLDTKSGHIEETNSWNDTYWGVCNGVGKNWMGVILMELRERERRRITSI